ncbi:haloacid dehalogenase [Nibricoccus aquaticus]|uniref:phosphoserine phosphatase n=1 Tax=Nibricoccus aquaticus TaxID=2576891 RepID=A0A290QBF6_9BACT|nr:haloacid dehalogenase [Nibricoccus aquaticus]
MGNPGCASAVTSRLVCAVSSLNLIIFDCDSTLSSIEGIDELGRVKGPGIFRQVEAMTNEAMDGKIAVEAVFGRRLEIIRPTRAEVEAVGRRYIETIEPTARATISGLVARGWTPMIISGGFRPAIRPLADLLGIARVEAVDLFFDAAGAYRGFDEKYPTTRSGGKPEVIQQLRAELKPARVVMVGDGVSDLETKPVVDLFVGFGRYVVREKVRAGAGKFIVSLDGLNSLL